MALSVLDGNQSATTLSSVVTGGEHIVAHTVVSLGSTAIANIASAVSGGVVSVSNFPASQSTTFGAVTGSVSVLNFPATQTVAGTVTVGNTVTVAGTVTANPTGTQTIAGTVTASGVAARQNYSDRTSVPVVRADDLGYGIHADNYAVPARILIGEADESEFVGYNNARLPISGTVTVGNLPSGALTTRFGSVTTANTAQLTSAVTNANRKYLLLQNISTGAVTVGVGFVPTTTQGIALTAGVGLTFDAFCPTGAVHWLGATTGAAFTILEG